MGNESDKIAVAAEPPFVDIAFGNVMTPLFDPLGYPLEMEFWSGKHVLPKSQKRNTLKLQLYL